MGGRGLIPDRKFIEEIFTGTTANRPKWIKLKKELKSGDTVRLALNLREQLGIAVVVESMILILLS